MITLHTVSPASASPLDRPGLLALADEVEPLISSAYWNQSHEPGRMAAAHLGSTAWVIARDGRGRLVGTARALSDGAKTAWIYDVLVIEALRGQGVGRRLMNALLAHPAVRGVRFVHLSTSDADPFYATLGFGYSEDVCRVPWRRVHMSLDQGRVPFGAWEFDSPRAS